MHRRIGIGYWLGLAMTVALTAAYAYERDLYGLYLLHLDRGRQVAEQRRELEQLELQEQRLRQRVDRLNTDQVEIEALIRRDKRLVREGETIYRVRLPQDDLRPVAQGE